MGIKRILVFNDSLAMGGTENLLVDFVNHLSSKGCAVTLLLPMPSEENVLLSNIASGIKIHYLYKQNTSFVKRKLSENLMIFAPLIFSWFKKIKSSDYDIAVCFKESFYAKLFTSMSIPKLLWIHNILYKRVYEIHSFKERLVVSLNKIQIKSVQNSYIRFNKVICVSDACKEAYLDVLYDGKMPKQDIRILYNAIDLDKVVEKSKEPIADLPKGQVNFILITRLSPEKRTDRLIDAATRLHEEGYDFKTYIIGEGIDNDEMKTSIHKRGLQNKIVFKGRLSNPFPYVLQSDWLLCVSQRESFSLVLIESMALGTPVITTDCGGPADIVDGGKYGILVDNSAEGVYQGMKMVLDDKGLSVKYSAHLDEALQRFDYKYWLRNIDELLGI